MTLSTETETLTALPGVESNLSALAEAILSNQEATPRRIVSTAPATPVPCDAAFTPLVPQTLDETGLTPTLIEQLVLKVVHFRGEVTGRDLAKTLGLKYSLIDGTMEHLKRQRLLEVKSSLGYGNISAAFTASEAGRQRAREYLEVNQYADTAPVPVSQYAIAIREQRLKNGWLTKEALVKAYRHMVLPDHILGQIGPAVNSGKSFLIYGQPGNGKTFLAEALFNLESTPVYVPRAVEYQGQIIKVFDPVFHHTVEQAEDNEFALSLEPTYDGRWVRCKRPFIVTGGELSLDMLDLNFNQTAKFYDAPFQLKANNGIYLIDDFGRQKATPAEVLNRWIVPMDRRVDYLSFQNGGKVEVPFETFLIFSTNLRPEQLGDEAFLRRMQYKMFMRNPGPEEFAEIFYRSVREQRLECDERLFNRLLEKHYHSVRKPLRRCQPRDIISHAVDLMHFERLPMRLTEDILDRAFEGCFLSSDDMD